MKKIIIICLAVISSSLFAQTDEGTWTIKALSINQGLDWSSPNVGYFICDGTMLTVGLDMSYLENDGNSNIDSHVELGYRSYLSGDVFAGLSMMGSIEDFEADEVDMTLNIGCTKELMKRIYIEPSLNYHMLNTYDGGRLALAVDMRFIF